MVRVVEQHQGGATSLHFTSQHITSQHGTLLMRMAEKHKRKHVNDRWTDSTKEAPAALQSWRVVAVEGRKKKIT